MFVLECRNSLNSRSNRISFSEFRITFSLIVERRRAGPFFFRRTKEKENFSQPEKENQQKKTQRRKEEFISFFLLKDDRRHTKDHRFLCSINIFRITKQKFFFFVSMKKIDFHFVNETLFVSAKWHYASGTIAALCLIFGLISNGTVLLIFFRFGKKQKLILFSENFFFSFRNSALRRPKNYFLINLALTDLGLLLTDNTMHIIASFQRRWPFGDRGSFSNFV